MSRSVRFHVSGTPAPQGSKNAWGGEANPRTRPWRAAVTAEASLAMNGQPLLTGPVEVEAEFYFVRPKAHFGTGRNGDRLKPSAPRWCDKKPDADKLARAIGDALSGVVFRDDAQIAVWTIVKRYGEKACAVVTVRELASSAWPRTRQEAA